MPISLLDLALSVMMAPAQATVTGGNHPRYQDPWTVLLEASGFRLA